MSGEGAMFASRISNEELPENGRVNRVRNNFLCEGDRGLALRLQEEEFNNHFNKNREERWVVRENLKEAKVVQSEEEERLQIQRMTQLEQMQELARQDEELARRIQEEEGGQEPLHVENRQLAADEILANRIEEYEKERLRRYREYRRRQLEQEELARNMEAASLNETVQQAVEDPKSVESQPSEIFYNLTSGLSEEEIKVIQELEDHSLATLLQEADSKQIGASSASDRLHFIRKRAIELRDEQLARFVQQREINRFNGKKAARPHVVPQIARIGANNAMSNPNEYSPIPMYSKIAKPKTQPDSDTYANITISSSNNPRAPTGNPQAAPVTSEYMTPSSLFGDRNSSSSANDEAEYVEPLEEVPIDYAAINASRRRRQQHDSPSFMEHRLTEMTKLPALPVITPGAVPTVAPPAHRKNSSLVKTTSSQRTPASAKPGQKSMKNGNVQATTDPVPEVTNPMYIIERPSKSKNKSSDCKQQ